MSGVDCPTPPTRERVPVPAVKTRFAPPSIVPENVRFPAPEPDDTEVVAAKLIFVAKEALLPTVNNVPERSTLPDPFCVKRPVMDVEAPKLKVSSPELVNVVVPPQMRFPPIEMIDPVNATLPVVVMGPKEDELAALWVKEAARIEESADTLLAFVIDKAPKAVLPPTTPLSEILPPVPALSCSDCKPSIVEEKVIGAPIDTLPPPVVSMITPLLRITGPVIAIVEPVVVIFPDK